MVLRVDVEALLELEIREGRQVLLLRERADDRSAELESFRQTRTLILRADAGREHLLRARNQVIGLDREIGGEEQGLLVDAPVRKSIGRDKRRESLIYAPRRTARRSRPRLRTRA